MSHETVMHHKGFHASVMEAERLKGDQTFGLPPGSPLPVYPSEIFKEYPGSWMRGPGVFVIPVVANKGLWFNWTMNDPANTAVLPTVKGCNPITGLQTSGFHLDRYESRCPKHDAEFGPDRFCEKCGYKWPFGNYVASPNILWLDGYRIGANVRQFFFTEDEVRDIASKMIGKQNTVPAFGFAFYRPKVERPRQYATLGGHMHYQLPHQDIYLDTGNQSTWTYYSIGGSTYTNGQPVHPDLFVLGDVECQKYTCSASAGEKHTAGDLWATRSKSSKTLGNPLRSMSVRYSAQAKPVEAPKKDVAVGAGAKIQQDLAEDPYPLDTWKDKPDSVMTIYFVFKEQVDRMLKAGTVEVEEKPEGMLEGLPVG